MSLKEVQLDNVAGQCQQAFEIAQPPGAVMGVSARTTGWLERMMRELGRRLEKIAFGWSERGAARMACVILRRITEAAEWEAYWRQRLGLNNNVSLSLRSVKALQVPPQALGH